ncbi:Coproporphyrinogen III oxidase, oxygen-independent, partial [hydrothermal vent metagenome]
PCAETKLAILKQSIEQLISAGYVYIGMDHFAKPDDELSVAQQQGKLYRNFQGYATHADCDLVGMGITAIGTINNSFAQNVKTLDEYQSHISAGNLAVYRGVKIDDDDRLRRAVIMQLICHFNLNFSQIESKYNINFNTYFADEIKQLMLMCDDELIKMNNQSIDVLAKGRLLIRNVCMVFDRHLRNTQNNTRFSKAI